MPSAENDTQALALARQLLPLVADRADMFKTVADLICNLSPFRHSIDFACVRFDGTLYSFTATQSKVVKLLWEAWKNGTPNVRQDTLMEGVDCESKRISDIFKGHAALNTLIVPGEAKGTFRLNSD